MKIRWVTELNGRSGLVADPEGYDGTPWLRELWLDTSPVKLHQDRIAIAASLIFGRHVASRFEFERAISPGVSTCIKDFCGIPDLDVAPIEYHQKAFAFGNGTMMVVGGDATASAANDAESNREAVLRVLRSDHYTGSLLSMDSLSVASNAYLHNEAARDAGHVGYADLAVGVLFAEDLGLDRCVVRDVSVDFKVRELLTAGGLRNG